LNLILPIRPLLFKVTGEDGSDVGYKRPTCQNEATAADYHSSIERKPLRRVIGTMEINPSTCDLNLFGWTLDEEHSLPNFVVSDVNPLNIDKVVLPNLCHDPKLSSTRVGVSYKISINPFPKVPSASLLTGYRCLPSETTVPCTELSRTLLPILLRHNLNQSPDDIMRELIQSRRRRTKKSKSRRSKL